MKKKIYTFIVIMLLIQACSEDSSLYSTYLPYSENLFKTTQNIVLHSTAAYTDSLAYYDDETAEVWGKFEFFGSDIAKYGHCWSTNSNNVLINSDSSNCTIRTNSGDIEKFPSYITGLTPEQTYYLRTYAILSNGLIGYNPNILKFRTDVPHDKWFTSSTLGSLVRCDAVSTSYINSNGDTTIFYGLGRTAGTFYSDFYSITKNGSNVEITPLKDFPGGKRYGAVAFTMSYTNTSKQKVNKIYVGLGADQNGEYKTDIWEYDPEERKWGQFAKEFTGEGRTGAVAFSIGQYAYIGLGRGTKNDAVLPDFYIFDPQKIISSVLEFNQPKESQRFPGNIMDGATTIVTDDYVYIVGGLTESGYSNKLYRVSRENETTVDIKWKELSNLPTQGRAFGAGFSINGIVYYGTGEDADQTLSDFYKYNPYQGEWIRCADFKNENLSTGITRAVGFAIGDRGWIGSGCSKIGITEITNYISVYRP